MDEGDAPLLIKARSSRSQAGAWTSPDKRAKAKGLLRHAAPPRAQYLRPLRQPPRRRPP